MTRLILVEGLPKYEGIDEAKAIADALNIMKKSIDGRRARHLGIEHYRAENKSEFLHYLEEDTDYLHISTHGESKNNQTLLKITRKGRITPSEILKLDIKAKVVFLNACQQSRKDMADAFFQSGSPKYRYFIAPFKEVPFDEAFLVALLFYRKSFLGNVPLNDRKELFKALEYAYKPKDINTNYFFWEGP